MQKWMIVVLTVLFLFAACDCGTNDNGNGTDTATIVVLSEPTGASIYLNGEIQSKTTDADFDVAPGNYIVKVAKTGYTSDPESVLIVAAKDSVDTASFVLTAMADTGYIVVTANYDEVPILINGVPSGYTPDTIAVDPGNVIVLVDGWAFVTPKAETVSVTSGATVGVEFSGLTFRRAALIEDFTHVNCPNCPAAAEAIEEALTHFGDSVLAIEWHCAYTGSDPFRSDNVDMHDGRKNYYGILGLPSVFVAGKQASDPKSSTVIRNMVDVALGDGAPLVGNFKLWGHYTGSESAVVGITALGGVAGEGVVRLIVVEDYHYFDEAPGSNGLTDFYNIPRRMTVYPSFGTFSLSAGETRYIELDFETPTPIGEGAEGNYYLIAWFEDDADGAYSTSEYILCSPCKLDQ